MVVFGGHKLIDVRLLFHFLPFKHGGLFPIVIMHGTDGSPGQKSGCEGDELEDAGMARSVYKICDQNADRDPLSSRIR